MTRMQRIFSLGNGALSGLAGGAVLGSSLGATGAIIGGLAGGIIGGIARNRIDTHRFADSVDRQGEKNRKHFVN